MGSPETCPTCWSDRRDVRCCTDVPRGVEFRHVPWGVDCLPCENEWHNAPATPPAPAASAVESDQGGARVATAATPPESTGTASHPTFPVTTSDASPAPNGQSKGGDAPCPPTTSGTRNSGPGTANPAHPPASAVTRAERAVVEAARRVARCAPVDWDCSRSPGHPGLCALLDAVDRLRAALRGKHPQGGHDTGNARGEE